MTFAEWINVQIDRIVAGPRFAQEHRRGVQAASHGRGYHSVRSLIAGNNDLKLTA
jgi:hypothetical protein